VRLEGDAPVPVSREQEAVAAAGRHRGWRVSGTTPPAAERARQAAVLASRRESLGERARGRLPGRPWSRTPRDRGREAQAPGGSRLVSLGVRGLTRLAWVIRRRLAAARTGRAGRSAGHPTRAMARPTTARRLEAFHGLTRTSRRAGRRQRSHLTPRSRVPRRMRALLTVPGDLETRLCPDSHTPPST
jgi:hypothetical protein